MPFIGDNADLDFADLPPFPTDVPTVPLLRISLHKLQTGDKAELDRLWKASTELGFFYLDLTPHPSSGEQGSTNGSSLDSATLLDNVDQLFKVGEALYALPVAEKVKYDFKSKGSYFGYKGYGDGVIDTKGTKDRNEFYNVSKDDILGLSAPLDAPDVLRQPRAPIKSYMEQCHAIVTLILSVLNKGLDLPSGTLESIHRLRAPSSDVLRWVRSPPQPFADRKTAMGEHSDFGSVTVLFNRLGGLQVLPPNSDGWKYVKPLRNHAIVNLGDAMVKFSAGVLRSNIHRDVTPPGDQGEHTRMSLVYFSRPEDEVIRKPLEGSAVIAEAKKALPEVFEEVYNAMEWTLKRALGRRQGGNYADSHGTEARRTEN